MPILLEERDIDPIADTLDGMLTKEDEQEAEAGLTPRVRPNRDRRIVKGRATVRRAWMWDGTESTLPLAWNPEGTRHDAARHYLLKRFCLCCKSGGFFGIQCPNCVKSNCANCGASSVRKNIIPCFYLKVEDVPFPVKFYGHINCFLDGCPRRDGRGFLTEQAMRMHARSRHRMEYQSHIESLAEARTDEMESLRRRLDALSAPAQVAAVAIAPPELSEEQKLAIYQEVLKGRMAKARAARTSK